MEQRQTQNITNIPQNVFIQYTNPQSNGDKNYYKLENIPFQHNTVNTINLNQPISLINQPCVINQNNAFINNQCVSNAPTNYVSLSTGNWNTNMQQVKKEKKNFFLNTLEINMDILF